MEKSVRASACLVFKIIILLSLVTLFASRAQAVHMNVPGDYASIQAAIEAAHEGDVIIVSPGTYYENISFLGKAITVRSSDPNNASIVEATIIDGGQGNSVVTFDNEEESSSMLSGFTIREGNSDEGGGIFCRSSSPSIAYCLITANSANTGGGIYCLDSSPVLTHCTVHMNSASEEGGGIYNDISFPTISDCLITENSAEYGGGVYCYKSLLTITDSAVSHNSASYGGGIYCQDRPELDGHYPRITFCTITENLADEDGGGIYCSLSSSLLINYCTIGKNSSHSDGGGIYCKENRIEMICCDLTENSAKSDGGGIYMEDYGYNSVIINCNISGNSAFSGGGGILLRGMGPDTKITNCVIADNKASFGGGIHCKNKIMAGNALPFRLITFSLPNPIITNCTITENKALSGGGIYISAIGRFREFYIHPSYITNCILWKNFPNHVKGLCKITHSNIRGRYLGRNNIMRDPLFVDPANHDYHLQDGSPCIDAGTEPNVLEAAWDKDGEERPRDGDSDGISKYDMGAYEYIGNE